MGHFLSLKFSDMGHLYIVHVKHEMTWTIVLNRIREAARTRFKWT